MAFTFEAAEKLRRVELLVREVIAGELLLCRQAWWLRGKPPSEGLGEHARVLTEAIPPVEVDRPLGEDISTLIELLESGRLQ